MEKTAEISMRSVLKRISTVLALLFTAAVMPAESSAAEAEDTRPVVTIGLVDSFAPEFYISTYSATVDYLEEALPQFRFRAVDIDPRRMDEDIARYQPDYLISSGSDYASLVRTQGVQQLVTKKPDASESVERSIASVFIALNNGSGIRTLADAKGKRAATASTGSFDGWIIALGEIASEGYDAEHFFSSVTETGYAVPDAVSLVKTGLADVGVLAACEYEKLRSEGVFAEGELAVLNRKEGGGQCVRSTELYPDVIFASAPKADPELNRTMLIALLSQKDAHPGFEWAIANSNASVLKLMRDLKIGPYAELREQTLRTFIMEHKTEALLALALLAAVLFHIITINVLVQRRTRELVDSQKEKERLTQKTRETEKRLETLERTSLVAQLSNLFAHEIKQPITSILYNAAALQMLLKKRGFEDPVADRITASILKESEKGAAIVERVRGYAKHRPQQTDRLNLRQIVSEALEPFSRENCISAEISEDIFVTGDRVELVLLIANLVRNALSAVKGQENPRISLFAEKTAGRCILTVSDNGPELSEENFSRLGAAGFSSKPDGLGFGLSIASAIAEKHGGHLDFVRRDPQGLSVKLSLPCAEALSGKKI